jgi:hypothetical protein
MEFTSRTKLAKKPVLLLNGQYPHQHLAPVRTGTVLKDVNPLPGAQGQISRIYRNCQAGIGQHGADVGGGIVGTLQIVRIPAISFRDEALHEGFQVCAGGRVPVFAYDQRGAGVWQEEKTHAFAYIPGSQLRADCLGDVVQSLTARGDFEGGFVPFHTKDYSKKW